METSAELKQYIDVEDGLKRVGGNMGLYKKLLQRFVEGNYYEAVCTCLQGGDMDGAVAAAHTIKGVGANLSLVKVAAKSLELEMCLKNGQEYSESLSGLQAAVTDTIALIPDI